MNTWYTHTRPDDLQGIVIDEQTGDNIAVTYKPENAALVAAAPELLDVLTLLVELRGQVNYDSVIWKDAADAIRKANGE